MNVKRRAAQFLLPGLMLAAVSGGSAVAADFALCSDAGKEASGAEKSGFTAIKKACSSFEKQDASARTKADEILKETPRFAAGFLHRAVIRARAGDAVGAASDFRESLKTPEGASVSVGGCLCADSLRADAEKLARKYDVCEAAKKKGVELFLAGKNDEALEKFNAAVSADPGDPEARMSRAVALEKKGTGAAQALVDYEQASKAALASGRWDMAADALLSSAKLGMENKDVLPGAVFGLEAVVASAPATWKRRDAIAGELAALKKEMEKTMPAASGAGQASSEAENKDFDGNLLPKDPRPDGEDKGQPDLREKVDPNAKSDIKAPPKFVPAPH
jgi:Tfp pilus assembly protein PilF